MLTPAPLSSPPRCELLDVDTRDERLALQQIGTILKGASQGRSYPAPLATSAGRDDGGADQEDIEDFDVEADLEDPSFDNGRIEQVILRWRKDFAQTSLNDPIAPIILSRIWARFSSTVERITEGLKHLETRYLGVVMHRTIIGFLHAVGYEAMRAANLEVSSSLASNPVKSGQLFSRLLSEIYDRSEKSVLHNTPELRFFDILFSCPVWAYFLARDESWEVEERRRGAPNEAIFKRYHERTSRYWDTSDMPFARVTLRSPAENEAAGFDGLFFILNTVPLQGYTVRKARADTAADAAVAAAARAAGAFGAEDALIGTGDADAETEPQVRRRRRRRPTEDDSSTD